MASARKRTHEEMEAASTEEPEEGKTRGFSEVITSVKSTRISMENSGLSAWSKLNGQRLDGRLCDVILVTEDGLKLYAHRCVLAASSDYFSRMFEQTGFADSEKEEIALHGVPGIALVQILDFVYTGTFELTTDNVHAIVTASDYLLFSETQHLCCHFMLTVLKTPFASQEAFKIVGTAEQFGFTELKTKAWAVILDNFAEICQSNIFKELSFAEMKHILELNDHYISEKRVWWAAVNWLQHDLEDRKHHVDAVLSSVRFPLLTTEMLIDEVKPNKLVQQSGYVKKLIREAMIYKMLPLRQSKMQTNHTKPRGSLASGVFCLVGTESFYVYLHDFKTWYSLSCPVKVELESGDHPDFSFNLVYASGTVYAIGKVRANYETGRYIVKSIQSYNALQNAWKHETLPAYKENTVFLECRDNLYACSRNNIESYDGSEMTWKIVHEPTSPSLPYDFVFASLGKLMFVDLSRSTMTVINVKTDEVTNERSGMTSYVGVVKGVTALNKDKLIVTMKSPGGYTRFVYNMKQASHLAWTCREVPFGLDAKEIWHMKEVGLDLLVLASHPSVMDRLGGSGRDRDMSSFSDVADGVIPFFAMNKVRGQWVRMPSIPEQPGKPICLCGQLVSSSTSAACSY